MLGWAGCSFVSGHAFCHSLCAWQPVFRLRWPCWTLPSIPCRFYRISADWLVAVTALAVQVVAPQVAQRVIDRAMQVHGAAGLSQDFVLPQLYSWARILRLADGPDEVHREAVARLELRKYSSKL